MSMIRQQKIPDPIPISWHVLQASHDIALIILPDVTVTPKSAG